MEEINYRKRDMADQHQMHLRSLKRMLERYKADSQKESRRKDFKCKYCTYINSGIGGSAITISKCKIPLSIFRPSRPGRLYQGTRHSRYRGGQYQLLRRQRLFSQKYLSQCAGRYSVFRFFQDEQYVADPGFAALYRQQLFLRAAKSLLSRPEFFPGRHP